jgi:hypothetical protein
MDTRRKANIHLEWSIASGQYLLTETSHSQRTCCRFNAAAEISTHFPMQVHPPRHDRREGAHPSISLLVTRASFEINTVSYFPCLTIPGVSCSIIRVSLAVHTWSRSCLDALVITHALTATTGSHHRAGLDEGASKANIAAARWASNHGSDVGTPTIVSQRC